jgi:hypothetical protein
VPELLEGKRRLGHMKILFLNGWHSVPSGVKPTFLKDHGYEVLNPALDDDDFTLAVKTAQAESTSISRKLSLGVPVAGPSP